MKYLKFIFLLCFLLVILQFLTQTRRTPSANVLLITVDALRPDHLGCYGYPRDTSPNIDKLAKEGVMFTQAISQASATPPAVTSLLTSSYKKTHNVDGFGISFPEKLTSLPTLLKANGYITAGISNYPLLEAMVNLNKKFDLFDTISTYQSWSQSISIPKKIAFARDRIIHWIRENKHKKFFLWVHLMDTHRPPLNPPPPYHDMFINDQYAVLNKNVPVNNDLTSGVSGLPRLLVKFNNDVTNLNYYTALYDGAIRFVDDQIGIILEELKQLGINRNTIVIISADHGEAIGERQLYFVHGENLYDEVIKIPLVIKYDKLDPKKKIIDTQVQAIDIAPTILDILDIRKPSSMAGNSLMPLIRGNIVVAKHAFSCNGNKHSIRTSKWKLILDIKTGQTEFYNLKDDPGELKSLNINLPKNKKAFLLLKKKLEAHVKKGTHYQEMQKRTLFEEEMKIKLKDLGYLQ